MMKKKVIILLALLILSVVVLSGCSLGNRQIGIDFAQSFDEAYIYGLDGSLIKHGNIKTYRDFEDSDVVQITIDSDTYLTHYVNVIMIRHENLH